MVCLRIERTAMPKQPDTTHADPVAELDRLQQELAGLPAATATARRTADVKTWMQLITRAEELPGLIAKASDAALRHRLAGAWRQVDAAAAAEEPLTSKAEKARAELEDFDGATRKAGLQPTSPEALQRAADRARPAAARDTASRELADAQHAVDQALYDVVALEEQLHALAGDEPIDGPGLRAQPQTLTANVNVPTKPQHPLRQDPRSMVLAEAGTRPPRWIAHRLADVCFKPRHPAGEPTEADRARAAEAEARWNARVVEHAPRLIPGNRQSRILEAAARTEERANS